MACQCQFQPFYALQRVCVCVWGGGGSSCSTHKGNRPTNQEGGSVPKLQDDGFARELGGIMEVTMWLCAPLSVEL